MLCGALAAYILALAAQRADQLVVQPSQSRVAGVTALRPAQPLIAQSRLPDLNPHPYTIVPNDPELLPEAAAPPGSIPYRFNGQTYYITPIAPVALR